MQLRVQFDADGRYAVSMTQAGDTPAPSHVGTYHVSGDTLTLYLHGLCCDIDVEPGPRQIASRHLRKRLEYMRSQFAPPDGYAVFPEELKN